MNHVTAVIKAKNEAAQILESIASARILADDILVVDDHSEDATAALAVAAGAIVISGEPHQGSIDLLDKQGFARVRDGWILRMDADERLTPALVKELERLIHDPGGFAGARYARRYWMFGAPVSFGGWLRPEELRFFRADCWDPGWTAALHSQVPVFGRIATIDPGDGAWMEAHDYADVPQFAARSLMKYAATEAAERYRDGARFRKRDIVWRPSRKLAGRLFIRHGHRDGARGWVLAALLAAYEISVYAHLWDVQRQLATDA